MLLCVVYALGFIVAFGGLVWGLEYLRRARNVRQTLTQMMAAGEWVLITGASSGLGAEFAKSFAAMGYSCVLVARGQEGLDKMAASLHRQYGVPVKTIAADLSNREEAQRIKRSLDADSVQVGVLVNNAGVGYAGWFGKQDTARLAAMVELNCVSLTLLTSLFTPGMLARKRGVVIMVSSVSAYQPLPTHAVYAASKAYVSTLSLALWEEMRDSNVHVLAVEPGTVVTEFATAAGQAPHHGAMPSDVVRDAMQALNDGRSSTVYGTYVWVRALAASVFPRAIVSYLAKKKMAPLDCNTSS